MRETSILVAGVRGGDGVTPVGCLAADRRLARTGDDGVPDDLDQVVRYGFDVLAVYVFRRHRGNGYGAALAEAAVRVAEGDLRRVFAAAAAPTGLRATLSAEAVTAAGARICGSIAEGMERAIAALASDASRGRRSWVARTDFARAIGGKAASAA